MVATRLPVALVAAVACLSVPAAASPAVSAGKPAGTAAAPVPPPFAAVIPKPLAATSGGGVFTLQPDAHITAGGGAGVRTAAVRLARFLRSATGYALPVTAAASSSAGDIRLGLERRPALGAEGYELRVASTGVTLVAHRGTGLLRGLQTMRQLLPTAIESPDVRPGPWRIRTGTIRDRPRFPWRGAMLDVARHFFGVADVKRYLDLLARRRSGRRRLRRGPSSSTWRSPG